MFVMDPPKIENNPLRAGLEEKNEARKAREGAGESSRGWDRVAGRVKSVCRRALQGPGRAGRPVFAAMLIQGVWVRGRAGGPFGARPNCVSGYAVEAGPRTQNWCEKMVDWLKSTAGEDSSGVAPRIVGSIFL